METIVLDFIKGLGIYGVAVAVIIYLISNLPAIVSNWDNLSNRKLKKISDFYQIESLDENSKNLLLISLTEANFAKLFKVKVTLYQINKINDLYKKLNEKVAIGEILKSLNYIDLEKIDKFEEIIDFEQKDLDAKASEIERLISWSTLIPTLGNLIYSLVGSYTGLDQNIHDFINSNSFLIYLNLVLALMSLPFVLKFKRLKQELEAMYRAYLIRLTLEIESKEFFIKSHCANTNLEPLNTIN